MTRNKTLIRGRFSQQATNGSETAVMDVIGYICVSQGSSTGSRPAWVYSEDGFGSLNGDRDLGVYYRRAAFCCAFFCG
jgi:hypothetical protein